MDLNYLESQHLKKWKNQLLKINIFSTGTEITSGKSLDTNSKWIANELSGLGFKVNKFVVMPDDPKLIESEIRYIMGDSEKNLIIITGGLGATEDDYTLEVGCKISNSKPVTLKSAEDKLKKIAERRGQEFKDILDISKRQTTYPENSEFLENETGLAVGFYLFLNKTSILAAMPGVPIEMKSMFENKLLPKIKRDFGFENLKTESRWIWGVSESVFQESFIRRNENLIKDKMEWGVTAKPGYIKLSFKSEDENLLKKIISILEVEYKEKIEDDLYSKIHQIFIENKKTISTAESCTGGLCSKIITDMSGSSAYFYGSVVSYDNSIKKNIIHVKEETLEKFGAVSQETAEEMAVGVKNLLKTNYSISLTGIAGPLGETPDKKLGLLYICISGEKSNSIYKYNIPLSREVFREYAANIALFHLYKKIKDELK